jgi:hypothetical protein
MPVRLLQNLGKDEGGLVARACRGSRTVVVEEATMYLHLSPISSSTDFRPTLLGKFRAAETVSMSKDTDLQASDDPPVVPTVLIRNDDAIAHLLTLIISRH